MSQDFAPGVFRITKEGGYCPFSVGGDTYRGCAHGCLYCYERQCDNQNLRKGGNAPGPRDYRALFQSLYEDVEVRTFAIDRHIPVLLGTVSDPFPPREAQDRVTFNLLSLLNQAGISALVTTKAPHRITAEYLDMLGAMGGVVNVSFCTFDDARAALLEPGAIAPSQRLAEMRRIKDVGIPVVARLAPYLFTEQYDYDLLVGACDAVALEFLRFSVTWRALWPVAFWEAISGKTAPAGEYKKGSDSYKWAVEQEKAYFARGQSANTPYHSEGYHWVMADPFIFREILLKERKKAHDRGLRFGICNMNHGIHNIDLCDGPYCCQVNPKLAYDEWALIPQWHRNRWADFRIPAQDKLDLNLTLVRAVYANSPSYRPIAAGGERTQESYYVEQDWKERG